MEDASEKHPVTPGHVLPARELLGEMLLELKQPALALKEFEASHKVEPNRFRGLYGAARAAELSGDHKKARAILREACGGLREGRYREARAAEGQGVPD